MIVDTLELHNFMAYRKFKRKFGDKSIIGLLGRNRSGKSVIPEERFYAINGKSRASKETELIHRGQKEMWVKFGLREGKKRYKIIRGRDINNKGFL